MSLMTKTLEKVIYESKRPMRVSASYILLLKFTFGVSSQEKEGRSAPDGKSCSKAQA